MYNIRKRKLLITALFTVFCILNTTMVSKAAVSENLDYETLCMLTFAESGLEPEDGQVAVAAVILNRMNQGATSLYEVMNAKKAFSSVKNGNIYIVGEQVYYEDVPDITKRAVDRALAGEDPTESLLAEAALQMDVDPSEYADGGALYFYNPDACSEKALKERENVLVKVTIGSHIFYKVWPPKEP